MFSCQASLLATTLLLLAGYASADGFTTGITRTRCNIDPSRAQVNNPCPSIYNAECDGNYCRCPRGQVEHPNLHKCVPGEEKHQADADHDRFGDLPFDYVPPGQTTTQKPRQLYNDSIDVSNTRCTAGNDPCPSLHSALCSHGYCVCPEGYMQDPNKALCRRDTSPQRGGTSNHDTHDDQDNHDDHEHHGDDSNDRDHGNGSTSIASNTCVVSLVASLLVCTLIGRH